MRILPKHPTVMKTLLTCRQHLCYNPQMQHVMIDIETIGTVPGSAIVSIGAYNIFTGEEFYTIIDLASNFSVGMSVEASTVEWWISQSDAAKAIFKHKDKATLAQGLQALSEWLPDSKECQPWANCCSFDLVLLEVAYRRCKLPIPWKFTNCRSYRTAKALFPGLKAPAFGVKHNALDDAKAQGMHLKLILEHLSGRKIS